MPAVRRIFIGLIALVALFSPLAFAAPARSDGIPNVPSPCGGPVPCGSADEKVNALVNRVQGLCPGNVCPLP